MIFGMLITKKLVCDNELLNGIGIILIAGPSRPVFQITMLQSEFLVLTGFSLKYLSASNPAASYLYPSKGS